MMLGPAIVRAGLAAALTLCAASGACAQDTASAEAPPAAAVAGQPAKLRVFLDAAFDPDLIKTEITFVDYVNDRLDADLHLIETTESAAAGLGFTYIYLGRKAFDGVNDTLRYMWDTDVPEEVMQRELVRIIKLGLVRYAARTPAAERLDVFFTPLARAAPQVDPWDHWVFRLTGSGGLSGSKTNEARSLFSSVSVDRVTEFLKLSLYGSTSYSESSKELSRGTITNYSRSNGFDGIAVIRLADRWSAGLAAGAESDIFSNYDLYLAVGPAVEYNFYPYSEYATKYFLLYYVLKYVYTEYDQITLYDKQTEKVGWEKLALSANVKRPWGSISSTISASNYLHDFNLRRLTANCSLNIQLFKGFWLNVGGSYSAIHDQINLVRGRMSDEDVLLARHERQTNYSYSSSISLSYRFGSKFANIVNQRLNPL